MENKSKNLSKHQKNNWVNLRTSMNLKEKDLREESRKRRTEPRRDTTTWLKTMKPSLEMSKSLERKMSTNLKMRWEPRKVTWMKSCHSLSMTTVSSHNKLKALRSTWLKPKSHWLSSPLSNQVLWSSSKINSMMRERNLSLRLINWLLIYHQKRERLLL